ncbi:acetylglutamate kinase [Alkalicoccobacillus murimartini]|uniref:Acetylglutamate kinase n=1 Tax=Alkalicoccobacillus murimartini TaxID=171685 RepID=A0ABT9YJ93_9BACI|nr:acetylglutamate kinase [Alkalicoccobacillus murimartini]MDQ0207935.1 acetylglutamate kinase [Alkalicoccobacillus murimartini]
MSGIVVIKCGGSTLNDLSDEFFQSVVQLKRQGKHPVIVHGGGPDINRMLEQLEIKSEFVDGLRKTTTEVLDTVEMVLCGRVNKQIVKRTHDNEGLAVGLAGCDANLLVVKPVNIEKLGFVGQPVSVNTDLIHALLGQDLIPVIAPIGVDEFGTHFNINADTAAAAVAEAMVADELVFVTDVDGILKDGLALESVTDKDVYQYIEDGVIYGGMIPKVRAALQCLKGPLSFVRIVNGKHAVFSAGEGLKGTKITKQKAAESVS